MNTATETSAAKNAEISRRILANISAGMAPAAALDAVIGAGTWAKIVDELYHDLRTRAGMAA